MVSWPAIASTGATLALLTVTFWQAREISSLRDAVKQLQEPPPPPPPAGAGRTSKPMFAGLYAEEKPGALAGLSSVPGARVMAVAGVLAVAALGLGLLGGSGVRADEMTSRGQLDSMRLQLDSVSARLQSLGDTLRLVAAPVPKPTPSASKPAAVQRVASRPTAVPAAPQILPAPTLPGTP